MIPKEKFGQPLDVEDGDLAAVVYNGKIVFAIVGDEGPKCKLGEGSIQLHEALDHHVCLARDGSRECTKIRDASIDHDVLFFIFRGTAKTILTGLTPGNINQRIQTEGARLWGELQSGR